MSDFKLRLFKNANSDTSATPGPREYIFVVHVGNGTLNSQGGREFGLVKAARRYSAELRTQGDQVAQAAALASLEGRHWKPQQRKKKPHLAKKTSNESNKFSRRQR